MEKKYRFECWYRYDEDEKDFFIAEMYTSNVEETIRDIKSKDRRIFKVTEIS